jgi:tetratricopeptide (TPR) repeat protein
MTSAPSNVLSPPVSAPVITVGQAFLDPRGLIDASDGQRFVPPAWPVLFIAMALVVASASLSGPNAGGAQAAVVVGLVVAWCGHFLVRRSIGRAIAAEVQAVNAIEELVQLRRWMEAADLVQRVLSRPMYLRERRLTALLCLATLLTRYHRFADARVVHDYLLQNGGSDINAAHSIRVARAMGMLREDYLVDADKAMNDLRREVNRARDEVRRHRGGEAADDVQSAGLALLELYRDVKTRHYEEAVQGFERSLPILREQLGMRVADAWLLVAAARHGLGQTDAARIAYTNATALAPAVELHRRYPEASALAEIYSAPATPAKAGRL